MQPTLALRFGWRRAVLGDRSFDRPWGGSVVDSVIGTFLTQNVSDTLSSTAYMQLVAAFPPPPQQPPPREQQLRHDSASHTADWDAVRRGENSLVVEEAIQCRGMHKMLTRHIQSCLNGLREELSESRLANLISHHRLPALMRGLSLHHDAPQQDDLMEGGVTISNCSIQSSARDAPSEPPQTPRCRCGRPGCSGELCLEWLRALPANEANEYLQKIDGLGGKSASCISLLCLGHKVIRPLSLRICSYQNVVLRLLTMMVMMMMVMMTMTMTTTMTTTMMMMMMMMMMTMMMRSRGRGS